MTDKSFYKAAAAEVAHGVIDNALWLKVNAENPGATAIVRQAKYIQLRAQELSIDARSQKISSLTPRTPGKWALYLVVAFAAALLLGAITDSGGVFSVVLIAAAIGAVVLHRKFGGHLEHVVAPPHSSARPQPEFPPPGTPPPVAGLIELAPPRDDPSQVDAGSGPLEDDKHASSYMGGVALVLIGFAIAVFIVVKAFVSVPGPPVQLATAAPTPPAAAVIDNAAYNLEVDKLVRQYPELDPQAPTYSAALNTSINAREHYYETHGMAPIDALDRAVDDLMRSSAASRTSTLDELTGGSSLPANPPVEPSNPVPLNGQIPIPHNGNDPDLAPAPGASGSTY